MGGDAPGDVIPEDDAENEVQSLEYDPKSKSVLSLLSWLAVCPVREGERGGGGRKHAGVERGTQCVCRTIPGELNHDWFVSNWHYDGVTHVCSYYLSWSRRLERKLRARVGVWRISCVCVCRGATSKREP